MVSAGRATAATLPIAPCSLAALYIAGNGVDKDPQKGLALCQGVAEQGSTPAMLQMGWLLLGGRNTSADASNDLIRNPAAAFHVLGSNGSRRGIPPKPSINLG